VIVVRSWARDDIPLADALRDCGMSIGTALLSSPTRHVVAQVRDGVAWLPDREVNLDGVFETRAFDRSRELRWLHREYGRGRVVVLAEEDAVLPPAYQELAPLKCLETIEQQYLLWGQAVAGAPPGWTTLTTARIGSLTVPAVAAPGDRIRLQAIEYVAVDAEHGNAYVAEERLLGLATYSMAGGRDRS
jgi:CRISPR-associated protein (TIGR03984 family)